MKNKYGLSFWSLVAVTVLCSSLSMAASVESNKENIQVQITQELNYVDIEHNGKTIRIQRNQNQNNRLNNSYAKTSRKCPPFCVQPHEIAGGVATLAEIEVLEFIKEKLSKDEGLLIDGRLPNWYQKATIPGAINLPFTIISSNLETTIAKRLLLVFGADKGENDVWDFSEAQDLLFFGNGAWGDQSSRAISNLLQLGYPAEKIKWYRGGLQSWLQLGFTVIKSEE